MGQAGRQWGVGEESQGPLPKSGDEKDEKDEKKLFA